MVSIGWLNYNYNISGLSTGMYGIGGLATGIGFSAGTIGLVPYDTYIGVNLGFANAFNIFGGGFGTGFGFGGFGFNAGFTTGIGYNVNLGHLSYQNLSMVPIYRDIVERRAVYRDVIEKRLVQREEQYKMRDYFFEYRAGRRTRTQSPIVLDLNGDGKFDVTDRNPGKDGRVDGRTVKFDIAPDRATWQYRSYWAGRQIYNSLTPQQRKELREKGYITLNPNQYARQLGYRYRYARSNKEMELRLENGRPVVYYGQKQEKENVEWLKPGAKDGLLVWDVDGDGKITSSKELFGEYDIDGRKRFRNGYEKLAHYFDKNKDGVISGDELKGLKVWIDKDADGITDTGELHNLSEFNITKLSTKMSDPSKMEANFTVGKNVYETVRRRVLAGYQEIHKRELAGYQIDYTRLDYNYASVNPYFWFLGYMNQFGYLGWV